MGAGHEHGAVRSRNSQRLAITLGLVTLYMMAEVVGGLLTNSLALLADAGHMLSDSGALALSLFATWIAGRPAKPAYTYGYYRTEILAALVNGATLVAVSIFIFLEAFERIGQPPEVRGALMMGIATGGLAINLIGLWILNAGRDESLNMRGAWLHVLTDALGSIGAIAAGALIWLFDWRWADPVASVLIGLLVIYSSWSLLKETVGVLMESAPAGINVDEVRDSLVEIAGVDKVHDLHVWTITSGIVSLSAHVITPDGGRRSGVLMAARGVLRKRFGITHVTLQIEATAIEEDDRV
jgi:cobalt-zinc-cadmium efflux system protein